MLGLALSLLKISRSWLLRFPAQIYIDLFRGTPLLVQVIIIFFATPLVGIRITSLFFAGLIALSLNSSAYVAEIFRAGIQSIDKGQMEAGRASGLSYAQTMRHIIVPQAFPARDPTPDQRVRDAYKRYFANLRYWAGGVTPGSPGNTGGVFQRDAALCRGAHLPGFVPAPDLPDKRPRTPPEPPHGVNYCSGLFSGLFLPGFVHVYGRRAQGPTLALYKTAARRCRIGPHDPPTQACRASAGSVPASSCSATSLPLKPREDSSSLMRRRILSRPPGG